MSISCPLTLHILKNMTYLIPPPPAIIFGEQFLRKVNQEISIIEVLSLQNLLNIYRNKSTVILKGTLMQI